VLAQDYTFDRVRAVARATGRWFRESFPGLPVAVAHDTRFLGARFAAAVADELAACGIEAHLCPGPLPTPAASFYVVSRGLAGAVVLTASHNPAEYNGFKVKRREGCSVFDKDAKWIESQANDILAAPPEHWAPARDHVRFDVRDAYLGHLLGLVDRDAIARAGLTVVADLMHGAGAGYFDEALRRAGCAQVHALRADPDPTFDGRHPEPVGPNLIESTALTTDPRVHIGLATDGDGDRLGVMAHGEYVDVQRAIVFILYHLLKNRGWQGRVVRAVDVTSMVDRLCQHYGAAVIETSIGFKNLAHEMIASSDIMLAVEESGGFGIRGHIPDRDGALAALVACEALAYEGKPFRSIMADIFALVGGPRVYDRLDVKLTDEQRARVAERLPGLNPGEIAGQRVVEVNRMDGAKYLLTDGAWVMLRLSGTEPIARIYAEGVSQGDVRSLLDAGHRMVRDIYGGRGSARRAPAGG
jgi:phosphomannomutase